MIFTLSPTACFHTLEDWAGMLRCTKCGLEVTMSEWHDSLDQYAQEIGN